MHARKDYFLINYKKLLATIIYIGIIEKACQKRPLKSLQKICEKNVKKSLTHIFMK